jgi:hypothetical protein
VSSDSDQSGGAGTAVIVCFVVLAASELHPLLRRPRLAG